MSRRTLLLLVLDVVSRSRRCEATRGVSCLVGRVVWRQSSSRGEEGGR